MYLGVCAGIRGVCGLNYRPGSSLDGFIHDYFQSIGEKYVVCTMTMGLRLAPKAASSTRNSRLGTRCGLPGLIGQYGLEVVAGV